MKEMNKKQTTGLVIAAIIFVLTGVISVLTNALSKKMTSSVVEEESDTSFSSIMDSLYGDKTDSMLMDMPTTNDFIAVVPVEGTIQPSSDTNNFYSAEVGYNHELLMSYVDKLIDNNHNKGIVLRMDTPGGTVYEADELYLKLMEYKEKTGRPIWAYMKSYCCSGGVYIASAADEQYANRNTTTGSIGVIISTYDLSGLYKKLGVKEINIVSDKNKDMGSSGKAMTAEQKAIYQSVVDEAYDQFVGIVADGRKMPVDKVKELADGRIYTAKQAKENGLIDGIMGQDEFNQYVEEQSGVDEFYEPNQTGGYFQALFGSLSQTKEKSEAEVLVDLMDRLGSGVPMYYANIYGE